MSVADLLQRSVQAHQRARAQRNGIRVARSAQGASETLASARSLRLQALTEDPERLDPAWVTEKVPHDEMMAFYRDQLGDE